MTERYSGVVPKLWNTTIEAHRRTVHAAIMEATWALVSEHGVMAVTMSQIAERSGIGRATLYKYFPDVEAILAAHHERHVADHLAELVRLRDQPGSPADRLAAVLRRYAFICHHRAQHGAEELAALLHRHEHVARAEHRLLDLFAELLADVGATGELRDDVAAGELAHYCLHALGAAGKLPSEEAVSRLVTVTLAGLRPSAG